MMNNESTIAEALAVCRDRHFVPSKGTKTNHAVKTLKNVNLIYFDLNITFGFFIRGVPGIMLMVTVHSFAFCT